MSGSTMGVTRTVAPPAATWRESSSRRWSCSRIGVREGAMGHPLASRVDADDVVGGAGDGADAAGDGALAGEFGGDAGAASSSRWSTYHTLGARARPEPCTSASTSCLRARDHDSEGGRRARRCPRPRRPPARARRTRGAREGRARGGRGRPRGDATRARRARRRRAPRKRTRRRWPSGWRKGAREASYPRGRRRARARGEVARDAACVRVPRSDRSWPRTGRGGRARRVGASRSGPPRPCARASKPSEAPSGGGVCQ